MNRSWHILDRVLAGGILLLVLPLLALISLAIRLDMGAPVLFRQVRAGLHGQAFAILKFRTMNDRRDAGGKLLPNAQRLTALGRLLRTTSLDELPELLNVLRGEMALVGPRPLYLKYLPYYSAREHLRHSVLPGITGWAQIHGRNFLPWDERLALDVWYVEHRNLWLDLRILALTVGKVLRRDGAAADPEAVETDLDQERRSHHRPATPSGAVWASCRGES